VTVRKAICALAIATLLTLTTCKEKFGTYKLNARGSEVTVILYRDSTFSESAAPNPDYTGHWWVVSQKDSIIQTIIEWQGGQAFTLTPTRSFKIEADRLVEVNER
jgi:hypothetical protein